MATTVRDLITGSLRLINVVASNEAPSEDDIAICQSALEGMIDSWSNDSLLIYTINPYVFSLVGGQSQYTLGPGGDFDVTRPMNIQQAYVNWNMGQQKVDMPIQILNDAQFAAISVKQTPSSFPFAVYDNGNYPLRTLTFWPVPTTNTDITLWLWQPLIDTTDLDAPVSFPPGYERAFRFGLAVEIAPEFGKVVPDDVKSRASMAIDGLKKLNAVPQYSSGDGGLGTGRNRPFNWIVGNFLPWR